MTVVRGGGGGNLAYVVNEERVETWQGTTQPVRGGGIPQTYRRKTLAERARCETTKSKKERRGLLKALKFLRGI